MSTQIPVTYQNLKTKLLAELNNTSHVSLTTDIWTSLQTTSYSALHYRHMGAEISSLGNIRVQH